jgi:hypothetical protein
MNEIRQYINGKRTGKTNFQHDIHRQAPEPSFQGEQDRPDDDSSDDDICTPSNTESSTHELQQLASKADLMAVSEPMAIIQKVEKAPEKLHVAGSSRERFQNGLAYGDYNPSNLGAYPERTSKNVEQKYRGFLSRFIPPSVAKQQLLTRIALSSVYAAW